MRRLVEWVCLAVWGFCAGMAVGDRWWALGMLVAAAVAWWSIATEAPA